MWRIQAQPAKQPGPATSLWSSASISSRSLKSWPQRKRGEEGRRVGSSQRAQTGRRGFPGAAWTCMLFLLAARNDGLAFPVHWEGLSQQGSKASALQDCTGLPLTEGAEPSHIPSASPVCGDPGAELGCKD